jgi:hypothetical protein
MYPNPVCITKSGMYKIGRNKYLITSAETEEEIKTKMSVTAENLSKMKDKKATKPMLPKNVRESVDELTNVVKKNSTPKSPTFDTFDAFEQEEENISDVMRENF